MHREFNGTSIYCIFENDKNSALDRRTPKHRAGGEVQMHTASQAQGAADQFPTRNRQCSSPSRRHGVNRGLDAAGLRFRPVHHDSKILNVNLISSSGGFVTLNGNGIC